jgi:hypothetical protein
VFVKVDNALRSALDPKSRAGIYVQPATAISLTRTGSWCATPIAGTTLTTRRRRVSRRWCTATVCHRPPTVQRCKAESLCRGLVTCGAHGDRLFDCQRHL